MVMPVCILPLSSSTSYVVKRYLSAVQQGLCAVLSEQVVSFI